jgi:hypothetical protein
VPGLEYKARAGLQVATEAESPSSLRGNVRRKRRYRCEDSTNYDGKHTSRGQRGLCTGNCYCGPRREQRLKTSTRLSARRRVQNKADHDLSGWRITDGDVATSSLFLVFISPLAYRKDRLSQSDRDSVRHEVRRGRSECHTPCG